MKKSKGKVDFLNERLLYGILLEFFFLIICITTTNALNCPNNTWPCDNGIQCINATLRCNSIIDCQDGSDEGTTCSKT